MEHAKRTDLYSFWRSPGEQTHVWLLKMFGLEEGLVVPRGSRPEAAQQGHVVPVYPHQLALPNAVVKGARVEVRKGLLGNDGTAEPLEVLYQVR